MSYKRTFVFFVIFLVLCTFFYFYEVKGKEARTAAEGKAKLVLDFDPDTVTSLILEKPDGAIVAEKGPKEWVIQEPVSAPADGNAIEQMLDALSSLKYERAVGAPEKLEPFGLTDPGLKVVLEAGESSLGALLLGAETPDGRDLYVKKASEQDVYSVGKSVKGKIDRSAYDLRDKTILDLPVPEIQSVTVERGKLSLVFEKDEDEGWTLTAPEKRRADSGKVTGLLDSIKYGRIKGFVEEDASDLAKYGLDEPIARVEFAFEDHAKSLVFGKTAESQEGLVYASREGQRQVLALDADILEKLPTDVDDWRDRKLVHFAQADLSGLQIVSPDEEITIERSQDNPDEWFITEPSEALADADEINTLLSELRNARIERFLDEEESDKASALCEHPAAAVTLWTKEKDPLVSLSVSPSRDESLIYAKLSANDEVFAANQRLLNALLMDSDRLKDRSVIRFDAADIEKLEVIKGEKSYEIARRDVEWKIPRGLDMAPYEIDQMLWELKGMKFQKAEKLTHEKAAYGLEPPAMTIKLWLAGKESPVHLEFGKKAPGQDLYSVVRLPEETVMDVQESAISDWLERF